MSVVQAFLLVALGASFVIAGFAIAVNKISAAYDRRGRARFMQAYYPDNVDAPGAFLSTADLPEPPSYERMW